MIRRNLWSTVTVIRRDVVHPSWHSGSGGRNSADGRAGEFAVRRGMAVAAQAMSRSAAEPKSRPALREISLVISFNGPSFSAVAALSSCLVFGGVGGTERERERGGGS